MAMKKLGGAGYAPKRKVPPESIVLFNVMREALRAWMRADVGPVCNREEELRKARELTGKAVDKGLLA